MTRTNISATARKFLNSTDYVERLIAKIPVANEFAEASRLTKMVGHFILDVIDGRDVREIKRNMYERGAEIVVDVLPIGSLATEALGIRKSLKEGVTRAMMAHGELNTLNFRGAWGALKTGQIPEYEKGSHGHKLNEAIRNLPHPKTSALSTQLALA